MSALAPYDSTTLIIESVNDLLLFVGTSKTLLKAPAQDETDAKVKEMVEATKKHETGEDKQPTAEDIINDTNNQKEEKGAQE